jgi:hypothetical protein
MNLALKIFRAENQFFAAAASATMFTRRLFLSNFTVPSVSANKVQSRPVPTFFPR